MPTAWVHAGYDPKAPKVPLVYQEFVNRLKAAGVNVIKERRCRRMLHTKAHTKHEQLILWIWRNLFASGVVLAASWYLHGEIKKLDTLLETVKDNQSKAMERHMDLQDAVYDIVAKQTGEYGEIEYRTAAVEPGSAEGPDVEEVVPEPLEQANVRLSSFLKEHREEVQQHMATQQLPAGSR